MIDWYRKQHRDVVRQALRKVAENKAADVRASIVDAIKFFNRDGDIELLRNAFIQRFGTRVISEAEKAKQFAAGTSTGDRSWYFDTRGPVEAAIDCGHVEILNTGLSIRIIQALATQFTEPDMSFQYVDSGVKKPENIDTIEELMNEVRSCGNYLTKACEMDMLSCMVESGWMHTYYKGNELKYDVVRPDAVTIKFGSKLVYEDDDGTKTSAFVDYTDIDDASAVIIRTAAHKGAYDSRPDEDQYLAYVGCCDDCLEGRYVVYHAKEPWPIPNLGDENIEYEHMEGNQECNPLTWMRHNGSDTERALVTTEYPLVLWRGGHRILSDEWPPITTSLYDDCLELEIGWSRTLRYALSGARGQDVFKYGSGNIKSPKSLDAIVLDAEDSYEHTGWPAAHAQAAASVLSILTEQTAGGFNVPGYIVLGQATVQDSPSGISLAIQTQPLIHFRNRRTRMNEDAMTRQFEIEKSLLVMNYPREAGGLLKPSIKQQFDPGTWRVPQDELTESQAIMQQLDNKTIDLVDAVKRRHRLPTAKAAIARIEEMAARDPEYTWEEAPKQSMPFNAPKKKEKEEVDDEENKDEFKK